MYSYAAESYAQIKQDVAAGKQVLFLGTPCQNAAVYNLVGDHPNLTLVNLICHGVPSLQMLREHLKTEHITEIHNIQFRTNNNLYEFVCNDYNAFKKISPDVYITLFLEGITYRPSCYACPYAKSQRTGDITIGDFWKLGRKIPFEGGDLTNGCSVIIVNTGKGQALIENSKDKLHLFKRTYEEAIAGNGQLRHAVCYGRCALLFNKLYPRLSFKMAGCVSSAPILLISWVKFLIKKYGSERVQRYCRKLYSFFNN